MFNGKYGKFLTVLLIIVIIAIVALLGYLGYDFYQKYYITKEVDHTLEQFNQIYANGNEKENQIDSNTTLENVLIPIINIVDDGNSSTGTDNNNTTNNSGNNNKPTVQMAGQNVMGKIEIPKTDCRYPILENATAKAMEKAVGIVYGVGLNQPGNTTISGHNYRNGLFFSNNKKLTNGDKIYITDNSAKTVTYTIYDKYETTEEDGSYLQRNTGGRREITLVTCTDDGKRRTIIYATAD